MDIQLLLNLQHVCSRKNIKLPWNEAAALVGPTISGGAVIQHLAKLRQRRLRDSLPVPDPLKRGGGLGVAPSTSRITTSSKKTAQKTVASNDEDEEEDFDVDEVSDSEASFGEECKKRVKDETKSSVMKAESDVTDDDDDEYEQEEAHKGVEADKNNKGKAKKHANGDSKRKTIKRESPLSPTLASVERAAERRTRGNTTQYGLDNGETLTESEPEEPRLATGSSFLKLVGVGDDTEEGTGGNDNVGIQDTKGRRPSRGTSRAAKRKVAVLKLGKSERSSAFLRQLGSSQIVEHSSSGNPTRSSFAPTSRSGSTNFGVDAYMAETDFHPQYYPEEINFANFRAGPGLPFNLDAGMGDFNAYSAPVYSTSMRSMMPPTPISGNLFGGYPNDPFGRGIGMDNSAAYSAVCNARANVPAFSTPYIPSSSRGLSGYQGTTFDGNGNNGQVSYDSSSRKNVGMGGIDLGSIGTSGAGDFHQTSRADEASNAALTYQSTTSGDQLDWTITNSPVMTSMPMDGDMFQFLNSGFNGDIGEPTDMDGSTFDDLFSKSESGPNGPV